MPTFFFHSGMAGAPTNTNAAGSTLEIIRSCLVTGFNLKSVVSASVASEVMTLNFAAPHGYEDKVWLRLDGAAGGSIVQRVTTTAGASTLTIPAAGFADGAVAGTLSTRVAPADWEEPFSGTGVGVFRSKVVGPGSTRFFYRVSDTASGESPRMMRGYEDMTDANTGTAPWPTLAQETGNGRPWQRAMGSTPQPWLMVVDQRTCYFFMSRSGPTQLQAGFFGDCIPYASTDLFFAGLSGSYISTQYIDSQTPWYVNRLASGIGSATTVLLLLSFAGASGQFQTYPSPIDGGMVFMRPVLVRQSSVVRGEMRGLIHCSSNPIPTESFFTVLSDVSGVAGRVLVCKSNYENTSCVAFPIDEDWP